MNMTPPVFEQEESLFECEVRPLTRAVGLAGFVAGDGPVQVEPTPGELTLIATDGTTVIRAKVPAKTSVGLVSVSYDELARAVRSIAADRAGEPTDTRRVIIRQRRNGRVWMEFQGEERELSSFDRGPLGMRSSLVVLDTRTLESAIPAGFLEDPLQSARDRSLTIKVLGKDVVVFARDRTVTTITSMTALSADATPRDLYASLPPREVARVVRFCGDKTIQLRWESRTAERLPVSLRWSDGTLETRSLPGDRTLDELLVTSKAPGVSALVAGGRLRNAIDACIALLADERETDPEVQVRIGKSLTLTPCNSQGRVYANAQLVDAVLDNTAEDVQRVGASALWNAVRETNAAAVIVTLQRDSGRIVVTSGASDEAGRRCVVEASVTPGFSDEPPF
jgi:hypothetical protein